jgi:hypothetical protein
MGNPQPSPAKTTPFLINSLLPELRLGWRVGFLREGENKNLSGKGEGSETVRRTTQVEDTVQMAKGTL